MGSECFSWMNQIFNKIRGYYFNNGDSGDQTSIEPLLEKLRQRTLIIRYFCPKTLKLYIIDGNKEKECKPRGLNDFQNPAFVATCGGLVLLSSARGDETRFAVFDPLSSEARIEIVGSPRIPAAQACAFFLHPSEKELRILAVGGRDERGLHEYVIYSFGTRTWRQTKKPYFRFRPRCYWKSGNSVEANAAVSNNALHWYEGSSNLIVAFDMVSEEFDARALPFEDYLRKLHYFEGYLSTSRDELRFCVIGRREAAMEVWCLEEYGSWRWCKKFTVDLSWDLVEFPVIEPFVIASYHIVRVVGFDEDEVVLFWRHRGLFVYNLRVGRVERVWAKKLELSEDCRPLYYDLYCGFAPLIL